MLFLYDTKHGSTEKIIKNIISGIKEIDSTIEPIVQNIKIDCIKLENYSDIYIFSPIYYGSPIASVAKFIRNNLSILKEKNVNMIIVGGPIKQKNLDNGNDVEFSGDCIINSNNPKVKEYFSRLYKFNLNEMSNLSLSYFLGTINPEKLSTYEKMTTSQNLQWNSNHIEQQKCYGRQIGKGRKGNETI